MAGPRPIYAEALLEKNGKVRFVGPLAGVIKDIPELVASLKADAASLLAGTVPYTHLTLPTNREV